MREIRFEYGFESISGIVKKHYALSEIPNIKEKCDVWGELPIVYVRQFTGLKDKNGKDIYDGDVIKNRRQAISTIGWVDGGFEFCNKNKYWLDDWNFCDDSHKMEIIGNIYENPELVNQ